MQILFWVEFWVHSSHTATNTTTKAHTGNINKPLPLLHYRANLIGFDGFTLEIHMQNMGRNKGTMDRDGCIDIKGSEPKSPMIQFSHEWLHLIADSFLYKLDLLKVKFLKCCFTFMNFYTSLCSARLYCYIVFH